MSEQDIGDGDSGHGHGKLSLADGSGGSFLRRHKWPLCALGGVGLAVGLVLGGLLQPMPVTPGAGASPVVVVETPEHLRAAAAGRQAEAAQERVAAAMSAAGAGATADSSSAAVARVRSLQAELMASEKRRLEGASAAQSAEGAEAARHREDLLRITYEAQLATLPKDQRNSLTVGLLKSEAELQERFYQTALAREKEAVARAGVGKTEPSHAWMAGAVHRGALGVGGALVGLVFGLGLFLYRDGRSTSASAEADAPHRLAWAEEVAGEVREQPVARPRTTEPQVPEPQGVDAIFTATAVECDAEPSMRKAHEAAPSVESAAPQSRELVESGAWPEPVADAVVPFVEPRAVESVPSGEPDSFEPEPVEPEKVLMGIRHGRIPSVSTVSRGLARVIERDAESDFPQSRDVFFRTQWGETPGLLEEACRDAVYSILLADWGKGIRSYAIVSPRVGDGKTTVLANMAVALGRAQLRVVVVEGNLRAPRLCEMFDVDRGIGLREILRGDLDLDTASIDELTSRTTLSHIAVVPSGAGEGEPEGWAESPRFTRLLERLSAAFDLVLVDTSSSGEAGEMAGVAKQCGGAILLLRAGSSEHARAVAMQQEIVDAGVSFAGIVVNGSDEASEASGY